MAATAAEGGKMEEAARLTELELLDSKNLELLEASLQAQVQAGTSYDSRNNLAILRLYQFYPEMMQRPVVENVLIKALTNLPEPCFRHCLCMLPQDIQTKPSVALLIELEASLQAGKFQAFWEKRSSAGAREMLDKVKGFDEHIRRFIVKALTITYQRIDVDQLKQALNLGDVRPLCAESGWEIDGDSVRFPRNKDNHPQPRTFTTQVKLSDMSDIIRTLTR